MDLMEQIEGGDEHHEKKHRLNAMVAVTIAILATFMGICKVKDDNIVQAMQLAQVDRNDHWAWYQARNIREEILRSTAAQFAAQANVQAGPAKQAFLTQAQTYQKLAGEQGKKKDDLKKQAEDDQKTYDRLNLHDDQFDLADAALALAVALLAITALTQKTWLYLVALIPSVFGVVMGVAGLMGLSIHPDALSKLLS